MFTKELSTKIEKLMEERKLTVESLATSAGLTREYVTKVKNGKQVPTLTSFEKLCSALEVEPNDLLLNKKSLQQSKAVAKRVNIMYCPKDKKGQTYYPVCPTCNALLYTDWESHCSFCGQKLSWVDFVNSQVTNDKPKRKKEFMGDYD